MKKLNPDWITEGLLDFEYKKYILLAYLQDITRSFNEHKLYPFLSDLIFHYRNLVTLRENREMATNSFPKKISRIDLEQFKIDYQKLIDDDDQIDIVVEVLEYAIPKLETKLREGKDIYEFVDEQIEISPIGVIPLRKEAGYLFIKEKSERMTRIYEYAITLFESADDAYRGIKTSFIDSTSCTISNTFEKMKIKLIKEKKDFANPATYLIESSMNLPLDETFLPMAKRKLVRYIATGTGSAGLK